MSAQRPAAVVVATAMGVSLLAGCTAAAKPVTTLTGAPTPTPVPTESHDPFPDRPESTVAAWPDHGDFVIDPTKAIRPAFSLTENERWDDYDYLARIAYTAQARWVGSWESDERVRDLAGEVYDAAESTGRIGLVAYQGMRDYPCERAVDDASLRDAYVARTAALVEELPQGVDAWIVMEPGLLQDLGSCDGDPRAGWLSEGIAIVADAGAAVYLDLGPVVPGNEQEAADALALVDLTAVAGYSLNTGGHLATELQVGIGEAIRVQLAAGGVDIDAPRSGTDPGSPGLGFVVDTSRNGVPLDDADTCNDARAALGEAPRVVGDGGLDAVVWVKRPGESDGTCNGGPDIGQFSLAIALSLAMNADAGEGP